MLGHTTIIRLGSLLGWIKRPQPQTNLLRGVFNFRDPSAGWSLPYTHKPFLAHCPRTQPIGALCGAAIQLWSGVAALRAIPRFLWFWEPLSLWGPWSRVGTMKPTGCLGKHGSSCIRTFRSARSRWHDLRLIPPLLVGFLNCLNSASERKLDKTDVVEHGCLVSLYSTMW